VTVTVAPDGSDGSDGSDGRDAAGGRGTVLSVTDDGGGFDPEARSIAARRLGLVSMRERVEGAGGTFEIMSAAGRGTTVRARVPATLGGTGRTSP
jgi:signal transduction histidine kinase